MDRAEAEAWFNARGWEIRTYEEGDSTWIDLVSAASSFTVPKYASGITADEAIVRAKQRWDVQEATD